MPSKDNIEKEEFLEILAKYKAGKASLEEREFIDAYYNMFDAHEDPLKKLSTAEKDTLKNSMSDEIKARMVPGKQTKSLFVRWPYLSSAAACLLVLSVTLYFYFNRQQLNNDTVKHTMTSKASAILPGVNKAILTLANGTKVVLEDQKDEALIYRMMDTVSHLANAYNSVVTPRGTEYNLTLPDGSKVWLNSGSSIRFPTVFSKNERRIEMTGEVYFEIAKKKQPFIVFTAGQEVEVLGTHFNINAYTDEGEIKTTLLEGSVKVSGSDKKARFLKPGQQSVITSSGTFKEIKDADLETAVAWKNGYFKFDRQDLQSVMRQIARWYDVEVEYSGTIPSDEYVGRIKRSANVSGVLNILRLSKVNFTVEGRKIIVKN